MLTLDPPTGKQLLGLDSLQILTNRVLASLGLGQDHLLHLDQIQETLHCGVDVFVVDGWAIVRRSRRTGSWRFRRMPCG